MVHVIDQTPYNVNRQIISITIDRVDNPRIHEIEDVLVNLNMERLKLREVDSAMASEIQDLITERGRLLGEIPIEIDWKLGLKMALKVRVKTLRSVIAYTFVTDSSILLKVWQTASVIRY